MAERLLNISRIFRHCRSRPINRVVHLGIRYGTTSESEYLRVDSVGHWVCNGIAGWEGWLSHREIRLNIGSHFGSYISTQGIGRKWDFRVFACERGSVCLEDLEQAAR